MSRLKESTQTIRMLVAEDDAFQRLALIDILTLCSYEVNAVENGRLARDELLKEDSCFDIVLLNLMMPEMGGLELLNLMQSNEKLKDIPVIMMSADGEQEQIGECIKAGAKNYLIKPIRIQNCKSLTSHIDPTKKNKNTKTQTASLEEYEKIQLLGRGGAGSVHLVRRTTDGESFALKIIQTSFMSPQERKMAENEITLLKVLMGPTIIRYYSHFIENESIHIVMEYAEGGSLYDRINEHKRNGVPISNDQILYWTAQLVLGIMLMHNKNILHRDIKTQNMFLSKNDVIKLGDFGISKMLGTQNKMAQTMLGTPYFMSPEVCKGKEYGQKSDIWAIGCAIYEMANLKPPFEHANMTTMFEMISTQDYEPLGPGVSIEVKMLIHEMLQKEASQRPSIFEIANKQCIKEKIIKFVQENDCKESVESYFNLNMDSKNKVPAITPAPQITSPNINGNGSKSINPNKKDDEIKEKEIRFEEEKIPVRSKPITAQATQFTFPMDKLDEFSKGMKETLELKEIKTGYFTKINNVLSGYQIYEWIENHFSTSDENYKKKICQELLDNKFIHSVTQNQEFEPETDSYYFFQCDLPNSAINMSKIWYSEVRKPLFVSTEIIKILNNILKEINSESNSDLILNSDFPKNSNHYHKFVDGICELQQVDLNVMDKIEINAFFLNIYQIMKVHCILYNEIKGNNFENGSSGIKSWFSKTLSYIPYLNYWNHDIRDNFHYNINDLDFSISDIRDGILRGNRNSKVGKFKKFDKKDKRYKYIQKLDPRVVCLFSDEKILPKKVHPFWKEEIQEKLESICKEFLMFSVYYNAIDLELMLPKSFEIYKEDIGKNELEVVNWVLKYLKNINKNEILAGIKSGSIEITFPDN